MNTEKYQETIVTCVYNEAHRILKHRYQVHLAKCRKQFKGTFATCPYNGTHSFPEPELKSHMETCPDRIHLDSFVAAPVCTAKKIEINFGTDNIHCDEKWDDIHVASYDPLANCQNSLVLRRFDTGSKAEKREFHLNEKKRFQEIEYRERSKRQMMCDEPPKTRPSVQRTVKQEIPATVASYIDDMRNSTMQIGAAGAGPIKTEPEWQKVPMSRGRGRRNVQF